RKPADGSAPRPYTRKPEGESAYPKRTYSRPPEGSAPRAYTRKPADGGAPRPYTRKPEGESAYPKRTPGRPPASGAPRSFTRKPPDGGVPRSYTRKPEGAGAYPKRTDGNAQTAFEPRFAPRGAGPGRARGEHITPKPYAVQRREQTQAVPQPLYTAPRAIAPDEESVSENLLSGRNPIREALKSGRDIEKLMISRGELSGSAREIVAMAKERHVPVQEVDRARLDAITPHHQGMLAYASAYQYHTVDEMLALAQERNEKPFLVMLDGVTDPHNLGAVIRTAECAGAHGVIVQERRAVGLTPAAVKASAGAIEHIMVTRVVNLGATLDMLKERDIWAYAADTKGEDYTAVDFSGGAVIVIGAEGEGISRLVLEKCDKTVALPIRGKIDSLNASVAAGILLYAVLRSR
ncbi:MAG: 23S rRNA (guanosine(2251)-2'-O)-methyltransferase RlmB, partial [Bacillota bacterium]